MTSARKTATIIEVSKLSGVSTATVSRVVNKRGNVSEKTTRKVMCAINELSYRKNPLATGLKCGRMKTIGVVIPRMDTYYYMRVLNGIEDEAGGEGYALMFATTENDAEKETRAIANMLAFKVDALIVATSQKDGAYFERVNAEECPVILIDRRIPGIKVDVISEENRNSSRLLTQMLVSAGHRNIAVFSGDSKLELMRERLTGALDAISAISPDAIADMTVNCENSVESGEAMALEAFRRWKSGGRVPTAAVCLNSNVAEGVMLAARQAGLSVPGDLSLVSFGLLRSRLIIPHITAVAQDGYRLGRLAGRQVLLRVAPQNEAVPPCDMVLSNVIEPGDSIKIISRVGKGA